MGVCRLLGAEQAGHLIALALAAQVCAKLALGKLQGALVPADAQELAKALLVRGKPGHLADDAADELDALPELPLASRGPEDLVLGGHDVALVEARGDTGGRHVGGCRYERSAAGGRGGEGEEESPPPLPRALCSAGDPAGGWASDVPA